jgi:hypothetical protein
MSEHLESCLGCQAELAGYRHLLRVLRSLRDEHVRAPAPPFGDDGWRILHECLEARSRSLARRRLAGLALAVAAVGGGAVLARATRQSRLLAGVGTL